MAVRLNENHDDELGEVSEINVTPFIDVILVLLIIFMVAAPLSTVDIAVDLPASNAQPRQEAGRARVPDGQERSVAGPRQCHDRAG
jgi:biopolymer transport protein ExbD